MALKHDDDYYYNVVRENIRKYRKRIGLSATKFAQVIGSNTCSVYNWEQEKTHPANRQIIYRIKALDIMFKMLYENPDLLVEQLKDKLEL